MKKTILLSLMVIVLNVMYSQNGEIIYTEFNPYPCMTGLPSEQTITLDINHDGVDGVFAGTEDVPVKVYPNPASDYIKIEVYHSYQHIAVYSIDGRLVFETQDATAQPATINVANLKSGVYIIKVKLTDGNDYVAKIVKK